VVPHTPVVNVEHAGAQGENKRPAGLTEWRRLFDSAPYGEV
jgi:hypothetical protein